MALAVERHWFDVGRKKLPKSEKWKTLIAFRISDELTERLDAEIERQLALAPGKVLRRGDLVREFLAQALLVAEANAAAAKLEAKHGKKK